MQDTALTAPNAEIRRAGVDLNGLMTVLGKHLYSTPVVALRELVQNAHDSIIRRRIEQPGVEVPSRISVQVDAGAGVLRITDTGAGLTRQEIHDYLATVGVGYTRGLRQGGERHVQVNAIGKESISHFRVLERRGGHSYCEVRIETGRTHQIRVHAQHLGHPVAGDDKYGDPAVNKRLREQIGLKRLFLHAASLEFALDDGKSPYVLNAPLADELVEALDRLK